MNWFKYISLFAILAATASHADADLIRLFPLNHYDQHIATWIKPTDADFDTPLLTWTWPILRPQLAAPQLG